MKQSQKQHEQALGYKRNILLKEIITIHQKKLERFTLEQLEEELEIWLEEDDLQI